MVETLTAARPFRLLILVVVLMFALLVVSTGWIGIRCGAWQIDKGRLVVTTNAGSPNWISIKPFATHECNYEWSLLPEKLKLGSAGKTPLIVTAIPLLPIVLLSIMPVVALYLPSTRRRTPFGRCLECGYDLTAWHDARCPECGVWVPPDYLAAIRRSRRTRRRLRPQNSSRNETMASAYFLDQPCRTSPHSNEAKRLTESSSPHPSQYIAR